MDHLQVKYDVPKLHPHETAYDVVRSFPSTMLTSALADRLHEVTTSSQDSKDKFNLLESLLWLSSMPHASTKTTVLASGVLPFLQEVLGTPIPHIADPDHPLVTRSLGDALTCFGNLFENLGSQDWTQFASLEMFDIAEAMALNTELPWTLRKQATFALECYTQSAGANDSQNWRGQALLQGEFNRQFFRDELPNRLWDSDLANSTSSAKASDRVYVWLFSSCCLGSCDGGTTLGFLKCQRDSDTASPKQLATTDRIHPCTSVPYPRRC